MPMIKGKFSCNSVREMSATLGVNTKGSTDNTECKKYIFLSIFPLFPDLEDVTGLLMILKTDNGQCNYNQIWYLQFGLLMHTIILVYQTPLLEHKIQIKTRSNENTISIEPWLSNSAWTECFESMNSVVMTDWSSKILCCIVCQSSFGTAFSTRNVWLCSKKFNLFLCPSSLNKYQLTIKPIIFPRRTEIKNSAKQKSPLLLLIHISGVWALPILEIENY